ncbi:hypothetical protein CR513_61926, partial [Mucuna pruriens]
MKHLASKSSASWMHKNVPPRRREDCLNDKETKLLLLDDAFWPKECKDHIPKIDGQSFCQPHRLKLGGICGRYGGQIYQP